MSELQVGVLGRGEDQMKKRTASEKYFDLVAKGRTPQQVRAVARAVNDQELLDYTKKMIEEDADGILC